ncbi:hypothetical protein ACFYU5_13065 [Nocardia aobensis]|uniref:VOC domain-containing protein n=1 Tax=Nocardia aobensis TaxID=257277 RepID=A0ABW6P3J0_9NOCA
MTKNSILDRADGIREQAADIAELEDTGYTVEAVRPEPVGGPLFAFLNRPTGFRIELLSRAAESDLARCWAPGNERRNEGDRG